MSYKLTITVIFIFFISFAGISQDKYAGYVCPKCGQFERTTQAIMAHTCSKHGYNCRTTTSYTYTPVVTKTPEQIRAERDAIELKEAAEDANDHGVDCYDKKDWQTAINYFKVALEYVPGFEDAIYNLKKAEEKATAERQRIEREEEQKKVIAEQSITPVTLPVSLSNYMQEADKIIVPPPSWESTIHEQIEQIRLSQIGENNLVLANNFLIAAFDQASTTEGLDLRLKLLLIGAKSTNAAQNEAEIVVFKQTAWYERTLQVLKDKKQGPLLIAAIKALRDKTPMPAGISPELLKLAKATQDPSLGNSSVHLAMDAMLSKESKAAFFQTFKMEAIGMISDKIKDEIDGLKGEVWKNIEERVAVLKTVNSMIAKGKALISPLDKGAGLVDKEHEALFKSMIQNKINELEKNIQPFKPIPQPIINVMSFFDKLNSADN